MGRNNRQNDKLTTKEGQKWDIWLHTQKIHGSHVLLCTDGGEPDEQSLHEAAVLAAYYSQARSSTKVPVDYTPVKFVKKPAGSPPGFVNYTNYKTMSFCRSLRPTRMRSPLDERNSRGAMGFSRPFFSFPLRRR